MAMQHADIPPELNDLTDRVIGCAIEVHRHLGPGLLERVYEAAMLHELDLAGISAAQQVEITVPYKGITLAGQRADLVVADRLVVELKAVEAVSDVHLAQLVSYIRSGGYPLGLLINFHVPVLRKGLYRRINPGVLTPSPSATSAPPRSIPSPEASR
jgi:GxxExxY protein